MINKRESLQQQKFDADYFEQKYQKEL